MSRARQIVATLLPAERNFNTLKQQGLAGSQWSNMNDSDPGITILDQLCYALTEVGYCNNFSIADILTGSDGTIPFEDQFFLPSQILTTSPITLTDFRKLILDRVTGLRNLYIQPSSPDNGLYQVYLYLDPNAGEDGNAMVSAVDGVLNSHRNLAQVFNTPVALTPKSIPLQGRVTLEADASPEDVKSRINLALENYVSPTINRYGYQELVAIGMDSREIFNGPEIENGWIPDSELAPAKRDSVVLAELATAITKVSGVKSVDKLSFASASDAGSSPTITVDTTEVAAITLSGEFVMVQNHIVVGQGASQQLNTDLNRLRSSHDAAKVGAAVDTAPPLPTGKYRNISDYYSIQNTFPPVYGIGDNTPTAPAYRVAQSRQLRGYLMVFDQLLANQFTQLANVKQLFSFKGAETVATGHDKPYTGIPYQLFSPTYYCQPLYQVPDVKPLLLGNDKYRFQLDLTRDGLDEQRIWREYQQDPFNRYMSGLRQCMESDGELDDRRKRMLDHLLARHGEPATLYDEVITSARWYGSPLKTRIIIKSIYLQNYRLLSYNRSRGYDYLAAARLPLPGRFRLTRQCLDEMAAKGVDPGVLKRLMPLTYLSYPDEKRLRNLIVMFLEGYRKAGLSRGGEAPPTEAQVEMVRRYLVVADTNRMPLQDGLMVDGQLDMRELERRERIRSSDFREYSTFELKINLFLGLVQHYFFLADLLLILIDDPGFATWLAAAGTPYICNSGDLEIRVERKDNSDSVWVDGQCLITIESGAGSAPDLALYQAHRDQLRWLAGERKGLILLEYPLLAHTAGEKSGAQGLTAVDFQQRTLSLFPGYVGLIKQPAFTRYIGELSDLHWPVHILNELRLLSFSDLQAVIPVFVKWYNALSHSPMEDDSAPDKEAEGSYQVTRNKVAAENAQALIGRLMTPPGGAA